MSMTDPIADLLVRIKTHETRRVRREIARVKTLLGSTK